MYKTEDYTFRYIEFKDLDNLQNIHPRMHKELKSSSWDVVKQCPEIADYFPCCFYMKNPGGEVACWVMSLPDVLWANGQEYPWAWMSGLLTKPVYRGRGLATILTEETKKVLHEMGIAWGGVFSTDVALHIYEKLKFSLPGFASRYLLLKSIRPFLDPHLKFERLIRFLDMFYRPTARLIFRLLDRRRRLNDLDIALIDVEKIDRAEIFWPKVSCGHKFYFNDSPARLAWKIRGIRRKPGTDWRVYLIKRIGERNPVCYFIAREKCEEKPMAQKYKNFQLMTVMDFGFFEKCDQVYSLLLDAILNVFWTSDAEVLEVITNSESFESILKHRGLLKVGRGMSFTFAAPKEWNIDGRWSNIRTWHLTHFCGDGFSS